jgi:predicted enzyme related to lactoylglutathione lyase
VSATGTEPGTLWVGAILPDSEMAVTFYAELFRWEARETIRADSSGQCFSFSLSGRDVAAVGSERGGGAPSVPARRTYIRAESDDYTVAR